MEAWGDPWADASDERAQVERQRHVLENWQDDTGWREWQDGEAGSRSGQIEKAENSQPASIQIPTRTHTISDSIDSAVSFGAFPDDIPKPASANVLPMDGDPDSAMLSPAVSSGARLLSSTTTIDDANKIQLLQGQYEIQDASNNVDVLSSDSPEAAKDDAAEMLFSVSRPTDPASFPEPNAIISSISSRKLWYRLTRKETLRAFNTGESDAEYVRVNWDKSNIRKMTVGIVSGFAADDRFNHMEAVGTSRWCRSSLDSSQHLSRSKIAGRNTMTEPTRKDAKTSHVPCNGDKSGRRTVSNSAPAAQFSWSTLPLAAATLPTKFDERVQASCTIRSPVVQSSDNTGVSAQQDLPEEAEQTPTSKYIPGIEEEEDDGDDGDDDDDDDDEWGEMVGSGYVNEKKILTDADDSATLPTDSWRRNIDNSIVEEFVNSLPDISYIFK